MDLRSGDAGRRPVPGRRRGGRRPHRHDAGDEEQIRRLSEAFFRVLTRYFFRDYSPRTRRLLVAKLRKLGFTSIYKYFFKARYGFKPGKN